MTAASDLLLRLRQAGLTVGTAESLTGGLVVVALTDVPGASQSVVGSVVSYATRVKRDVLGVDAGLLLARGAVDPDVARQMARGVCRALGCDVGLATTGVAGPDPSDGRPVGTVFVAVATATGPAQVEQLALAGDRDSIRRAATEAVLRLADDYLSSHGGHPGAEEGTGSRR